MENYSISEVKTYEIIDFERRVPDKKEFITKFGGTPDWIKKENCPLSLGWDDRKMTFIGQIIGNCSCNCIAIFSHLYCEAAPCPQFLSLYQMISKEQECSFRIHELKNMF